MPLDPKAKRFLDMLALSSSTIETAAQRREGFEKLVALSEGQGPQMQVETFNADSLPLRLYRASGDANALMVFFHGGGLVAGSIETHDTLCRKLVAASNVNILSVGYRRAPEAKFPAQIEDGLAALHWLSANCETLRINPTKIALGGDSIGGLIAILLLDETLPRNLKIACLLLLCPVLDLNNNKGSRLEFAKGYLIDASTIARDIADCLPHGSSFPSATMVARSAYLPTTLIHSAECDPFRDEAGEFAALLASQQSDIRHTCHQGMVHSFYMFGRFLPQAETAIKAIGLELAAALA